MDILALLSSILSYLPYILWVVLAIMLLVLVHELGHFLAARLFGMRVERFSIGFPPHVLRKKIGDTEFVLGLTPLGGYVKIAGMIDESMDTEFLEEEPKPWEFRAKPVWQRMIVISAGVIFNFLFAVLIFIGLKYTYGDTYIPADKIQHIYVEEGSLAYEIGLRTGDRIVAINGKPLKAWEDLFDLANLSSERITFTVERNGRQITLTAPEDLLTRLSQEGGPLAFGVYIDPAVVVVRVLEGSPADSIGLKPGDRILSLDDQPVRVTREFIRIVEASQGRPLRIAWARRDSTEERTYTAVVRPMYRDGRYVIGVSIATVDRAPETIGVAYRKYSLLEAVVVGTREAFRNTVAIVQNLKKIITGKEDVRENLGGPIAVAQITAEAARQGGQQFWFIVAMLSITLAIVNILPIPVLDGGHLVFLLYEGITGREPSPRVRMIVQQIGMVLILLLFVFLIYNDIRRF